MTIFTSNRFSYPVNESQGTKLRVYYSIDTRGFRLFYTQYLIACRIICTTFFLLKNVKIKRRKNYVTYTCSMLTINYIIIPAIWLFYITRHLIGSTQSRDWGAKRPVSREINIMFHLFGNLGFLIKNYL